MNNRVMLINFYSPKSLGFRFLEHALTSAGFEVTVLYFKGFHSSRPKMPTDTERALMLELIQKTDPLFIGMSVMSSLYLEAVEALSTLVKSAVSAPVVWGGVFATLFLERSLPFCDYVLRGEGEYAIVDLAQRLSSGADVSDTLNLAYLKDGAAVVNDVRPVEHELDKLGMSPVGLDNKYFIDNDAITRRDPMLDSRSYETSGSRGCPFVCAYCSTVAQKRIYKDKGFMRFRSVGALIEELKDAKAKMKKLNYIHFWDEIFANDETWVDEFVARYKKEINLPFEIWAHPMKTDESVIKKLVSAGLYQVVMGIQSGSPSVRKQIFHRVETQEQILAAAEIFRKCKVPSVYYDLIVRHPFESTEQLIESYELCGQLPGNFILQLHGLNFLPGTDIVKIALDMGLYTEDEMDKMMYGTMERQYLSWWGDEEHPPLTNFWYHLMYMQQFKAYRKKAGKLAENPGSEANRAAALKTYNFCRKLNRLRHYKRKALLIMRGTLG
ncbi:B12-binding domain-containing radical SAM protein [Clostridia bacterium]|nr:B12-binding domain-containing radical SAM protein [Clostridia bacterium]